MNTKNKKIILGIIFLAVFLILSFVVYHFTTKSSENNEKFNKTQANENYPYKLNKTAFNNFKEVTEYIYKDDGTLNYILNSNLKDYLKVAALKYYLAENRYKLINALRERNGSIEIIKRACRQYLYGSLGMDYLIPLTNLSTSQVMKIYNVSYVVKNYYNYVKKDEKLRSLEFNKAFIYCYELLQNQ